MTHYIVISPEISTTIPILDDGSGPLEYFCCTCFVNASSKKQAKILALKDRLMKDWIHEQRLYQTNPFIGLKVEECKCEHGMCWCDKCIKKFGECDECLRKYNVGEE